MSQCLIGKLAPKFKTRAVQIDRIIDDFSLNHLLGRYVVLFFYPLDFTFVCPTELHAFQNKLVDFEKRNACVVGCSVDSVYSHLAWLASPKKQGGIQGVTYPIIADFNKTIAREFQVLQEEDGIAFRGLFLIDKAGVVRHQLINDLPLGRSIDEALRVLDALIFYEQHGEVCPANWSTGEEGMEPTARGVLRYFN